MSDIESVGEFRLQQMLDDEDDFKRWYRRERKLRRQTELPPATNDIIEGEIVDGDE